MADKVEQIRAEVERLKKCSESAKKEWVDEGYNQNAFAEDCRIKSFNKLLSFIDSMNSGMNYDKLDAMLDDALAKETKESWNERLGKEEPVSEDLDTEIQKYKDAYIEIINNHSVMAAEGIDIIARHFVDWKRKQMMENAVEETVFVDRWRDQEVVSHYFDWDEGFKAGQKVKLIVIKQEEE